MTGSLLSRLQSLTEPDRKIDAETALANGWTTKIYEGKLCWRGPGRLAWEPEPPRYTESLDAVLTLVPDGMLMTMTIRGMETAASVRTGSVLNPATREWEGYSKANPAIALLVALEKVKEESQS